MSVIPDQRCIETCAEVCHGIDDMEKRDRCVSECIEQCSAGYETTGGYLDRERDLNVLEKQQENQLDTIGIYWDQIVRPSFRIHYLSLDVSKTGFSNYVTEEYAPGMYNVAELIVRYEVKRNQDKPTKSLYDRPKVNKTTTLEDNANDAACSQKSHQHCYSLHHNDMPKYTECMRTYANKCSQINVSWRTSDMWKHGDGTTDTWRDLTVAENAADAEGELYLCGLAIYVKNMGWDGWLVTRGLLDDVFVRGKRAMFEHWTIGEDSAEQALSVIAKQWIQERHKEEQYVYKQYRAKVDKDLISGKKITWRDNIYFPTTIPLPKQNANP